MKKQKAMLLAALVHVFLLCTIVSQSALAQTDRSKESAHHAPRNQQLLTSYRPMFANDFKQISYEDLDKDGDPDLLKSFINGDTPVMWIDDDDDMLEGDLEGDLDSDCMLVDRNKDGKYGHAMDFIVDFGDEDGDGDADIQVIADNVELDRTGWVFFPGALYDCS